MAVKMGGRRGAGSRGGFTEINITPLTDVFLVLVIILLITAPLIQDSGLKAELPTSKSGDKTEQKNITVGIDAKGQYALNGTKITPDNLLPELQKQAKETGQTVLVVQADANARQKDVVRVMDAARQAGLKKLVVATQQNYSAPPPLNFGGRNTLSSLTASEDEATILSINAGSLVSNRSITSLWGCFSPQSWGAGGAFPLWVTHIPFRACSLLHN
jgi:biopolymer transport protein ExbD